MFAIEIDKKISLKFPEKCDAAELFAVVEKDRLELGKWMPWVEFTKSIADEENFLQLSAKKMIDGELWMATILFEGKAVGMIDIHEINSGDARGEVGYWLAQAVQGQGIMTKVLDKTVELAFKELKLNRLGLLTRIDNIKSQQVARKAGFIEESTLKSFMKNSDGFSDAMLFAKINPQSLQG